MDNVYVVNHIIKRELKRKGGKVFGFFMDLRAAFDRVDRRELWKAMETRGIRTGIVERVKEIYEGTESAVRERNENSNWFWTEKGLRQGCPISPLLFALLVADINEELCRGQVEGVTVGKERIWSLAYADDMVLLAKNQEGMKEMMKRTERYLK